MNEQKTTKRATDSRRIMIWAGGIACVLLLILFASFAFLQTDTAKTMIASRLSAAISEEPERKVMLEGLKGFLPFDVRLDRVVVSDEKGAWLTVRDIALDWSPWELLRRRIVVEGLGASFVQVERMPAGQADESEAEPFTIPLDFPAVTIKRLELPEIRIEEPVVGQAAVFKAEGSLLGAQADGVAASLKIHRTDEGPNTRAEILAMPYGSPAALKLDAELSEEAGGFLSRLLHLEEQGPVKVSIRGDGPLDSWSGKVEGAVGRFGSLDASIRIAGDEEKSIDFKGMYSAPESFAVPRLAPLLRDENSFAFALRVLPSRTIVVDNAEFHGADYRLKLAGKLDLESLQTAGEWQFYLKDIAALEPLVGHPVAGELSTRGTLSGTLNEPEGSLLLELQRFTAASVRISQVSLELSLKELQPGGPGYEIEGHGKASDISTADGTALPEKSLKWSLSARVPRKGEISISRLHLQGEHHELQADALFDPESGIVKANATVHSEETGSLAEYLGRELPGGADLKVEVTGNTRAESASGSVEGRITRVGAFSPQLASGLGEDVSVNTTFDYQNGSHLTVPSFKLTGSALDLVAEASLDLVQKTASGSWKLSAPKLEPFSGLIDRSISGSLEAEGHVTGPFQDLEATASLKGTNVALEGKSVQGIEVTARASNILDEPNGNLRLELRREREKLEGATDFALEDGKLALSKLAIDTPGGDLRADLVLELETTLVSGSIKGNFQDLAPLGRLTGAPMQGSLNFQTQLTADKALQNLKADLKGSGIETEFARAEAVSVSADLKNVRQLPAGSADLSATGLEGGGMVLETVTMKAAGSGKNVQFQGAAKGHSIKPFDMQAQGILTLQGETASLQLEKLSGKFAEYPFSLPQPAKVESIPEGYKLDKLVLNLGTGRIQASGRAGSDRTSLEGEFERLPLGLYTLFGGPSLSGTASGFIRAAGTPSQTTGSFQIRMVDIRSPEPALRNAPALGLFAEGKLESGALRSSFELRRQDEIPISGYLTVPVRLSLTTPALTLPPEGELSGRIEGRTNLGIFAAFVPVEGHRFSGPINAQFEIGGTIAEPVMTGSANLKNATYEGMALGTILKDISAEAGVSGRRIELRSFRATDGEKGTLQGSGWVDLGVQGSIPLQVQARVENARLARRDDLKASATGEVQLSGTVQKMMLTGNLQIPSAEYVLPRRFQSPVNLDKLEIIEINKEVSGAAEQDRRREDSEPSVIELNLGIDFPGNAYVRGQGLNSEWQGHLQVRGPVNRLTLTGELKVIRGDFEFIGERFKLAESSIAFFGSYPIDPRLNIRAETRKKDVTARFVLTGSSSDPEVRFESDPPLPQDEVLARVLFNRRLNEITPMQAVRLADALRSLSGRGDALDVIERTRSFLGLQALEVREAEDTEGEFALGIGKYLTEDIYVDLEKGMGDETGRVAVTVELHPNVTLESKAGMDSGKGMGLNWKWDY